MVFSVVHDNFLVIQVTFHLVNFSIKEQQSCSVMFCTFNCGAGKKVSGFLLMLTGDCFIFTVEVGSVGAVVQYVVFHNIRGLRVNGAFF